MAWDADTLVFVDVKSHLAERSEGIKQASASTMRRIKRIADAYVQSVGFGDIRQRFDRIDLLVVASDRALLRHSRDIANNE